MDDHTRLMLLLARTLIADQRCWTRGVLARDRNGRAVPALDETAVCWCAHGAIFLIARGDIEIFQRVVAAVSASCRVLYATSLRAVNDSPSPFAHAAVLGAFDHAIQASRTRVDGPSPHAAGWDVGGGTAR